MPETCGQRITERMKLLGLTQQQLADILGVSRQAISLWQSDKTTPSGKNLEKLAAALKTTASYLLFGKEESHIKTFEDGDTPPDDVVVIHEYKLTFGASPTGIEPEPEWVIDEEGEDFWYKRRFFQRRHINPDRCKRARVSGDSMEPYIKDGDIVYKYGFDGDVAMISVDTVDGGVLYYVAYVVTCNTTKALAN